MLMFNDGKELTDRQRALFYKLVKTLEARITIGNDETIITLSPDEFKEFTGFEYNTASATSVYKMLNFPIELCNFTLETWYVYWPVVGISVNQSESSFAVSENFINEIKRGHSDLLLLNDTIKAGITSKCGLALYDLIINDAGFLPWTATLEDFKIAMGIEPGQYPRPSSLRERCFESGVEEINSKTPFKLAYKYVKDGKNITGLTFFLIDEEF